MDIEQIEKFELLIKELIIKLENSSSYLIKENVPIEPSIALGRLTRMDAIQEKSVSEEMQRMNTIRLEGLRNALLRIQNGSYGICLKCKNEISIGRLETIPEAILCINCANKKK